MPDRVILHSDLNNFYASAECILFPEFKNKPLAVCGDEKARHGIVLAKSEEAKKYGVRTATSSGRQRENALISSSVPRVFPYIPNFRKKSAIFTGVLPITSSLSVSTNAGWT